MVGPNGALFIRECGAPTRSKQLFKRFTPYQPPLVLKAGHYDTKAPKFSLFFWGAFPNGTPLGEVRVSVGVPPVGEFRS